MYDRAGPGRLNRVSASIGGVGAIFNDTARVFPAVNQFPIGESLTQVILSPQEAADFLYFLMSVISMESVRMITPSTAPISYSIEEDWTHDMDPAQRTRLRSAIETVISKAKSRKNGRSAN